MFIEVKNLSKSYGNQPAVQYLNLRLEVGQIVGFLWPNGAGKSTTFKSLTREITPTLGEISIQGFDIQTEFEEARKLIGYCP